MDVDIISGGWSWPDGCMARWSGTIASYTTQQGNTARDFSAILSVLWFVSAVLLIYSHLEWVPL